MENKQLITVPDDFFCPLSNKLMSNPVIDQQNHVFDYEAINEYLSNSQKCPCDGHLLDTTQLKPLPDLKSQIDQIRDQLSDEQKYRETHKSIKNLKNNQITLSLTKNDQNIYLQINPPKSENIKSSPNSFDICCVIDVSGSMEDEAKIQGDTENAGLTILDIVKHSVKTILQNLRPQDRLSIVSFHTFAKRELELTYMDEQGKQKAEKCINSLYPQSSTNLWQGLEYGLDVLKERNSSNLGFLMLFTDGVPNVEPPRGHLNMLQKYRQDNKEKIENVQINMFGFGYNLNSALLNELSQEGNGFYAFIPDASFVGTIFVNSFAQMFSTYKQGVNLKFKSKSFYIPLLNYDQTIDLLFDDQQEQTDEYSDIKVNCGNNLLAEGQLNTQQEAKNSLAFERARIRYIFTKGLKEVTDLSKTSLQDGQNVVKQLIDEIKQSTHIQDPQITDLLKDLTGQVCEAVQNNQSYNKWGKHYLLSLCRAHQLQFCNNFKDPGVQHYAGAFFTYIRDEAEKVFLKIPPPEPKPRQQKHYAYTGYPQQQQQPMKKANMRQYYNVGGGCFSENSIVYMGDGTKIRAENVKLGDMVKCNQNITSKVICVVKSNSQNASFIKLSSELYITPYHPVHINGQWHFPIDLENQDEGENDFQSQFMYDFVLENGHTVIVGGFECVTLGHNFNNEIVRHEYFGSQKVIDDLKQMKGWDQGIIQLNQQSFIRSEHNNQIIGINY